MQRANELDDMINTTGTVFRGSPPVARASHNRKFDPISQQDYYALKGIFEGVKHADLTPSQDQHRRTSVLG